MAGMHGAMKQTDDFVASRDCDQQFQKEMIELTAANDKVYGEGIRPLSRTCKWGAYAECKATGDFVRSQYVRNRPAE